MDRTGCIDVVHFGVQILLQQHPDWRGLKVAQVSEDSVRGLVTGVNAAARDAGIRMGMRLAHAVNLCPGLRAGVVSTGTYAHWRDLLLEILQRFSPAVEPCADLPGVFWLGAAGLERLYPTVNAWTATLPSISRGTSR